MQFFMSLTFQIFESTLKLKREKVKSALVILDCFMVLLVWGCGTSSGGDIPGDGAGDTGNDQNDQGDGFINEAAPDVLSDEMEGCDPLQRWCEGNERYWCEAGIVRHAPCGAGQYCRDGECFDHECVPGEIQCTWDGDVRVCAEDGSGFSDPAPCPSGEVCDGEGCVDVVCEPGQSYCTDASNEMRCNNLGSAWESNACPPYYTCDPDHCIPPEDCTQDIDVVFVIDVSTSMSFVLQNLSDGIAEVWNYALTFSDSPDYEPRFGLVVFVDDHLFTNSGAPYGSAAELQGAFDSWRAFTSSNSEPGGSPGYNNDCPENAIDGLHAGATGFGWRDGALHIIIFATDDTFREHPQTLGSGPVVVQHTYAEVLAEVLAREIRVAAFAAHVGVCWDSNNGEPGFFSDYGGQPALPAATGSRAFDIQDVASGTISMTEAIKDIILEEYCSPYVT
jgi:hypothetical protein